MKTITKGFYRVEVAQEDKMKSFTFYCIESENDYTIEEDLSISRGYLG